MKDNLEIRKKIYFSIICFVLVVTTITATYAYFAATKTSDKVLLGETQTYSFGLSVEKITNADNYGLIPMYDERAIEGLANNCVDMNNFGVCQIYRISVTNTGNSNMYLDGYLSLTTVTEDEMRFLRVYYDGDEFCYNVDCSKDIEPNIKTGITSTTDNNYNRENDINALLVESNQDDENDALKPEEKRDYYVLIWLHDTNKKQDELQGQENFFSGKVTFISSQGSEITAVF